MRNLRCWVSTLLALFFIAAHDLVLCSYEKYSGCGNMFSCGELQGVGYPFWGDGRPDYCGRPGFELVCQSDGNTSIIIRSVEYFVKNISFVNQTLKIARKDYLQDVCPDSPEYVSTTLDHKTFIYSPADKNFTLLYNCTPDKEVSPLDSLFCCNEGLQLVYSGFTSELPTHINGSWDHNVTVPVLESVVESLRGRTEANVSMEALKGGFEIVWMSEFEEMCFNCEMSYGPCGYNLSAPGFICLCVNGSFNQNCSGHYPSSVPKSSNFK